MESFEIVAELLLEPTSDNAIRVKPMIAPTVADFVGTRYPLVRPVIAHKELWTITESIRV